MVLEKVISQLEDLVSDRRSFIVGDGEGEYDDVFQKDIEALTIAVKVLKLYVSTTNFDRLKAKTRTFEGMVEMFTDIYSAWSTDCVLSGLAGAEIKCPPKCNCKECIRTWLSAEYKGSGKEEKV